MAVTMILTLIAAIVIGLIVGLLGGGGSILTVPTLIYLADMPPASAITSSLFIVGMASGAGLLSHVQSGHIQWRIGIVFGTTGMVGAYAGGRIAEYLPEAVLLGGFGLMMAITSIAMLAPRPTTWSPAPTAPEASTSSPPTRREIILVLQGLTVGCVTGLVGASGGFIIVPALVLVAGLPMAQAVGTSLLIITMQSFAGFAGHLHSARVSWLITLSVTAVAVTAAVVGGQMSGHINAVVLRRAFGWLVLAMAITMMATSKGS